jgi:two-component system CheB/CheR fusion protein
MQVLQFSELSRYVERLERDPDEVSRLFRDLLIGVTNFFRDADAFEALEQSVMPGIFAGRSGADAVRIWVPGCATGEEVYSIAILAREQMEKMKAPPRVLVFATDIDEAALTVARAGRYPAPLMKDVTPARLQRFFVRDDVSYMIKNDVREMCIFSVHNVLRNPPFSRIDLVSCRNLLIYLGAAFQSQVFPVFHFSLRPRGFLFLGTSENVSQHAELFAPVDKKHRIFQCREHAITPLDIPSFSATGGRVAMPDGALRRDPAGLSTSLRHVVEMRVLERFAPAHVVVNRDGEILHYSARTGRYLEPSTGLPTRQLAAMARKPLRLDLIAAFREAVETRRAVVRENLSIQTDDRMQNFDLVIEPLADKAGDPLYLILFKDVGAPAVPAGPPAPIEGDVRLERLDRELGETRERLQSLVEEYETAVEELKSSNEELQSVNEELQSSNEELETSKEELQSLNEELHTVNAELNSKIDELDSANGDLRNIFDSTQIATVFLDRDLVIRSFTPAVTGIFNLISTDRGRPLTDIVSHLALGDLRRDIRAVLEGGAPVERQVPRLDGKASYLMRVLPYRSPHGVTEGVLVTFVDVTRLTEVEAQQRALIEELSHRVHNMLSVVNAIAQQTLRTSASPEAFAETFAGRVGAIGTAYRLVLRQGRSNVPVRDVLREQMLPYAGIGDDHAGLSERVKLGGPEVLLRSGAVISFGLIVHELVTNALKYGALSNAAGKIEVSWHLDDADARALVLSWRESGGPPVKKPTDSGFGTKLIEREVSGTMGGSVKLTYKPAGLTAVLSIPLDRISDAS